MPITRSRGSTYYHVLHKALVARGLSVVVLLGQGAILDYFLLKFGSSSNYAWVVCDVLTALVWIMLLIKPDLLEIAVQSLRACLGRAKDAGVSQTRGGRSQSSSNLDYRYAPLESMWFAWLFYAAVGLAPRVCYIYYTTAPDLTEANAVGPNLLKVDVSLTAVLFLCLETAHERPTASVIRLYLHRVTAGVVIDLLDSVDFLDVFFTEDQRVGQKELSGDEFKLTDGLAVAVLSFSVINFILPTLGIIEMEHKQARIEQHTIGSAHRTNAKVFYMWARLAYVNLPFFIIRIVLWTKHDRKVSVLVVKNFILIIIDALDLWEFYFGKGRTTSSSSSLQLTYTDGSDPRAMEQRRSRSAKERETEDGSSG